MRRDLELLNELDAPYTLTEARGTADYTARQVTEADFSHELISLAQAIFSPSSAGIPHEVVFCGVNGESESTKVCLQIGQILASQTSRPVCLFDANVHTAKLSALLGREQGTAPAAVRSECRQVGANLFLTQAERNPGANGAVLAPAIQLQRRLSELRRTFDFVLIDTPGVNLCGDAAVLGQIADATILVVEADRTRKAAALSAKKWLEAMNVRLLGTILNNRSFPIPESLYRRL